MRPRMERGEATPRFGHESKMPSAPKGSHGAGGVVKVGSWKRPPIVADGRSTKMHCSRLRLRPRPRPQRRPPVVTDEGRNRVNPAPLPTSAPVR